MRKLNLGMRNGALDEHHGSCMIAETQIKSQEKEILSPVLCVFCVCVYIYLYFSAYIPTNSVSNAAVITLARLGWMGIVGPRGCRGDKEDRLPTT